VKGEAWLRAETPATVRAAVIEKPVVAAKLLRRAKSPVIVVGHEVTSGEGSRVPQEPGSSREAEARSGSSCPGGQGTLGIRERGPSGADSSVLDSVVRIAQATGATVVATGGISAELGKRGVTPVIMSAMEAGDRLLDPTWQPAPGQSPPDYAFLLGIPYPIASVIEAGLASFAHGHLKIVSLDRLYHPHCDLSLPNQTREEWGKSLGAIAREVEKV
jgi:CO dehydrogenase/acetyl-CoA synthase complex epsilon subunit